MGIDLFVDNVTRAHRKGSVSIEAVRGITLHVPAGSYLTITGPSGSGKSSLLQLLGVLDRPTTGSVRVDERPTEVMGEDERAALRRTRIGFVFQHYHLMPGLSSWENVALPSLLDGHRLRSLRLRAYQLLEQVGLGERAQHTADELSGGEQQRVAIARALMAEPDLLLADEPTGALDAATSTGIIELLEHLSVDVGRTLVIVTHNPEVASRSRAAEVRLLDGKINPEEPGQQSGQATAARASQGSVW
jgi:ABC-type lipoprotein export system ATPase subunit